MNKSIILAIIIAIIAVLWIGIGVIAPDQKITPPSLEEKVEQREQDKTDNLPQVRIKSLSAQSYTPQIILNGRTQASKEVPLRAESEGLLAEFTHEEGKIVKKGDLIVKIDPKNKKERVLEAKKRLQQRQTEYNAAKSLSNRGFNSKIAFAQSSSALEEARAALKAAQDDILKTQIKAPFAGTLSNQSYEEGDLLRVGDAVITLSKLHPLEVIGFVSEHKIRQIKKDSPVTITFNNKTQKMGLITYTSPVSDAQSRTFEIKASLDNEARTLVGGLTVELSIPLEPQPAYKISPSVLSLGSEGEIGVKLVNKDNIVVFQAIEILADAPGEMWIAGLPASVRLITLGQDFVSEGTKVDPIESESDGPL